MSQIFIGGTMTARGNKRSRDRSAVLWALSVGTLVAILLTTCPPEPSQATEPVSGSGGRLTPVDPNSLQPGLAVYYLEGFWRRVKQMPGPDEFLKNGKPGKSITKIDHRFGNGNVFDSGRTRGIGVQMVGFIHLARSGEWHFKVRSNDGIEVVVGETTVVSDPGVHFDRFSDPMGFQVETSDWYPILLRYFQRKGTATLEFYWKPPGEQEFTIIPERAYWHLQNSAQE
jgi:hypothetical protein